MAALAGKGVEVHGERGGECLAFARAHFSDLAVVENHCADELHVEVAHAEHAHGGFTNHGKSFGEELVGRRALGDAVAEFLRLGLQLFVRERLHGGLELVDGIALAAILLDQAVVATTEDFVRSSSNIVCNQNGSEGTDGTICGMAAPLTPALFRATLFRLRRSLLPVGKACVAPLRRPRPA